MIDDLEIANPQSGSSSIPSQTKLNLEMLVFEEREKPEYPKKKRLGAKERTNIKLT